jgi:4-diphosphocytidyl-2-C-methyl-D-erythritol kinase
VAAHRFPIIEKIKKELLNQGAMGSLMTGSGSAVFGLFSDLQAARRAGNALRGNAGWQVFASELTC